MSRISTRPSLKRILLLYSNGLHDYINDGEIAKKAYKPEESCRKLVDMALENSSDNVTVIVVSSNQRRPHPISFLAYFQLAVASSPFSKNTWTNRTLV